jgi:predicted ester cyclase
VASFISEEYVEIYDNTRYALGIEGAKRHIRGVCEAYPDLKLSIEQQIAEGDWVVTQITARGTHRGTLLGMKPTGSSFPV